MNLKAPEIPFIGDHPFTLNFPIKTLPCTNVCLALALKTLAKTAWLPNLLRTNMFGFVSALFGKRTLPRPTEGLGASSTASAAAWNVRHSTAAIEWARQRNYDFNSETVLFNVIYGYLYTYVWFKHDFVYHIYWALWPIHSGKIMAVAVAENHGTQWWMASMASTQPQPWLPEGIYYSIYQVGHLLDLGKISHFGHRVSSW